MQGGCGETIQNRGGEYLERRDNDATKGRKGLKG